MSRSARSIIGVLGCKAFRVVLAAEGCEGLVKVARNQPGVVLCDLTIRLGRPPITLR